MYAEVTGLPLKHQTKIPGYFPVFPGKTRSKMHVRKARDNVYGILFPNIKNLNNLKIHY